MSDLTTSLKEIFNERISSPFYGSLIVSWLLWNWKIPYVTFFIDQSRLGDATNKIDYIFKHCDSFWLLVAGPLASTGAIIFLLPYVTNFAFKKTAEFDRKRKDIQIEIDRTQLLTIDQSVKILRQVEEQKESFKILLSSRDEEIELLKKQRDSALKEKSEINPEVNPPDPTIKTLTDFVYEEELNKFMNNEALTKWFDRISVYVQDRTPMYNIPNDVQNYYLSNDLIEKAEKGFNFTEKGKYFLKQYTNKKFDQPAQDEKTMNRPPK